MPAATRESVRAMLAAQLGKADPDDPDNGLDPFWEPIVTQAHAEAEAWLRATLAGFGPRAIALWSMFEHYHRRLTLFWCGVYRHAELTDDQKNMLRLMDCREEVKGLESLGPDDPNSTADDAVSVGLLSRDDDLVRRATVGQGGGLPGDIFATSSLGYPFWR